jgi:hypothetical protein
MVHARCNVDTKGYKHIIRICNTYCFPTATVVGRRLFACVVSCHTLTFTTSWSATSILGWAVLYWIINEIFQYPALSYKCQFNSNMDDISTASLGHFDLNDAGRLQNPSTCFGYDL